MAIDQGFYNAISDISKTGQSAVQPILDAIDPLQQQMRGTVLAEQIAQQRKAELALPALERNEQNAVVQQQETEAERALREKHTTIDENGNKKINLETYQAELLAQNPNTGLGFAQDQAKVNQAESNVEKTDQDIREAKLKENLDTASRWVDIVTGAPSKMADFKEWALSAASEDDPHAKIFANSLPDTFDPNDPQQAFKFAAIKKAFYSNERKRLDNEEKRLEQQIDRIRQGDVRLGQGDRKLDQSAVKIGLDAKKAGNALFQLQDGQIVSMPDVYGVDKVANSPELQPGGGKQQQPRGNKEQQIQESAPDGSSYVVPAPLVDPRTLSQTQGQQQAINQPERAEKSPPQASAYRIKGYQSQKDYEADSADLKFYEGAKNSIKKAESLIKKSTSGRFGNLVDAGIGITGMATPGSIAISDLGVLAGDLRKAVQLAPGAQSNIELQDRMNQLGDIANPNKPMEERLSALNQFKDLVVRNEQQIKAKREEQQQSAPAGFSASPTITYPETKKTTQAQQNGVPSPAPAVAKTGNNRVDRLRDVMARPAKKEIFDSLPPASQFPGKRFTASNGEKFKSDGNQWVKQ